MRLLMETIKCCDGKLFNLRFHNHRFNKSRKSLCGVDEEQDLAEVIQIPTQCSSGLFRCRVIYSSEIEQIEFLPHKYRKIEYLKLVKDDSVDYQFKYSDRSRLEELFLKRYHCDDILIVKKGNITDSFTANPIFFSEERWWTPDTPLLHGTQRARLLEEGKIFERRITLDDLYKYEKVGLINAMQELDNMPVILVNDIEKL